MAALQYVDKPGYNAILFRRTFPQLTAANSLMTRAQQWLAHSDAKWNGQTKRFTFPSGATVGFGYCDTEDDVYKYDGPEYSFIGFDELTSFSEWQYLFSRLRATTDTDFPLRMRAASNPGNRGHDRVKERFRIGEDPSVLRSLRDDEGNLVDRFYLPATLDDNPSIRREDYIKSLMNLSPVRRAQLLAGNWDIKPAGILFQRGWFGMVDDYPRDAVFCRSWDTAATLGDGDWTVGVLWCMTRAGLFYVLDVLRFRGSSLEVENTMKNTGWADQNIRPTAIVIQQEPGASGKAYAEHVIRNPLRALNVVVENLSGDKWLFGGITRHLVASVIGIPTTAFPKYPPDKAPSRFISRNCQPVLPNACMT